jgi:hypothetical protein
MPRLKLVSHIPKSKQVSNSTLGGVGSTVISLQSTLTMTRKCWQVVLSKSSSRRVESKLCSATVHIEKSLPHPFYKTLHYYVDSKEKARSDSKKEKKERKERTRLRNFGP